MWIGLIIVVCGGSDSVELSVWDITIWDMKFKVGLIAGWVKGFRNIGR